MKDLVIVKNQKALTTSLRVAQVFEKNHRDVMRAIRNLTAQNCAVKKMFAESTYVNGKGQEQPMFYMNRDGFYLLAMGFTGEKAMQFKLEFINAFDRMEKQIKVQAELPKTPEQLLELTMQATNHLNNRVTRVENDVDYLKNKSEIDSTQRYQLLMARKKKVLEVVGGKRSNYYQQHKASKIFSEFGHDFKQSFAIPRYECLKKKDFKAAKKFTKNWYPSYNSQLEIKQANAQINLDVYRSEH